MQTVTKTLQGLFFATGLALAAPAFAQETPAQPAPAQGDAVLDASELDALAGGDGLSDAVITQQTLKAYNSGNTVSGEVVGSGQINIGSNAFQGFDGLGNFVMNTGHNNNLQSNLNVSILVGK